MIPNVQVVKLQSRSADVVLSKLKSLTKRAEGTHYTGLACILIAADGSAFTSTAGGNNRLVLLGAIHDLAHTLHTDGELPE